MIWRTSAARVWQILTSCEERRLAEYEQIPWWEFIDADVPLPAYQKILAAGITRSLVAAHAETASTRTIGTIFVQLLLDVVDPLVATSDRVLDGPTNQVWLYPWLQYLRTLGVTYLPETTVTEIVHGDGRISGVRVESAGGTETIQGDHYVCALPVERMVPLLTPTLLAADPRLDGLRPLAANCLEWMNGVQFYFRRPVRLVRGHMNHIDTEWALDQHLAGRRVAARHDGPVRPGADPRHRLGRRLRLGRTRAGNGRSATEHTREDVCLEVWRQLKRSVNVAGEDEILRDEDLVGWFIDSDIDRDPANPGRLTNAEPLLVNLIDSWRLRPDATHRHPEPLPRVRLRADAHRPGDDGGGERGGAAGGQRRSSTRRRIAGARCRDLAAARAAGPRAAAPVRRDAVRARAALGRRAADRSPRPAIDGRRPAARPGGALLTRSRPYWSAARTRATSWTTP